MANIVAATIRLLETTKPQDITLRDVARESGHGHRLIVEWFGGKGGLFAAVSDAVLERLIQAGAVFYSDLPLRPELRSVVEIFNFMQLHHPEFVKDARTGIVVKSIEERLQVVAGLSEQAARAAANRLALQLLGIVLFKEYFPLSDDDVIQMMRDEFKATTGLEMPDNPERSASPKA